MTATKRQLQTAEAILGTTPDACTKCKTPTSLTEDWTLYPWPDGAWLCRPCNDARHEGDDYDAVAAAARIEAQLRPAAKFRYRVETVGTATVKETWRVESDRPLTEEELHEIIIDGMLDGEDVCDVAGVTATNRESEETGGDVTDRMVTDTAEEEA